MAALHAGASEKLLDFAVHVGVLDQQAAMVDRESSFREIDLPQSLAVSVKFV